jgi:hypothetical protein
VSAPHVGSLREHYPASADLEPWPVDPELWWEDLEPDGDEDAAEEFSERIAGRR